MAIALKPVAFNETSYNVALLHKVLKALKLPVIEAEVKANTAGNDTVRKVLLLQNQLKVPVDRLLLVNNDLIFAINKTLEQQSLLVTANSFTVTGHVQKTDRTPKKRQRLLAFDLDLRGVIVYQKAKVLADLQNGGFEFLSETTTDVLGNYSFSFFDWQYIDAERGKADVVVYAVNDTKEGNIIGRSRMVNSEDYSDTGLVRNLNIIVIEEVTEVEYTSLMKIVPDFLVESKCELQDIATSSEQIIFTAKELEIPVSRVSLLANAKLLAQQNSEMLSHELLYGIGRQNIILSWSVLAKKTDSELTQAIKKSIDEKIIQPYTDEKIKAYLLSLRVVITPQIILESQDKGNDSLSAMLFNAFPKVENKEEEKIAETKRIAFLDAVNRFQGSDYSQFWNKLPSSLEKDRAHLLFVQQLTLLTGNHQKLVTALRDKSIDAILDLGDKEWDVLIETSDVPDFVQGNTKNEKKLTYSQSMKSMLNAAFPTKRIARMINNKELPLNENVALGIKNFFDRAPTFDFAASRIQEFEADIKATAGSHYSEVKSDLMKIQRLFQVSTSPQAMKILWENNLGSAYAIANVPPKIFIRRYGKLLGEDQAFAIQQRASHINKRAELAVMKLQENWQDYAPQSVMGADEQEEARKVIEGKIPNYTDLFDSPDLCECEHCRSVYSPAAYFIELLRFLWRSEPNDDKKTTPLDILTKRRPDLVHLPLTCENTNTLVPYIDLANEVMEHYVAFDNLKEFKGNDTGEATAAELRAAPQNSNIQAYRKLAEDAKYPFTLPYHQPLDTIHIYNDYLKISRYELLKLMNKPQRVETEDENLVLNAFAAEALYLSPEEYKILTSKALHGIPDKTSLPVYFGYPASNTPNDSSVLEGLKVVPELLKRSGIVYTDLIELLKTQFINPAQGILDFVQKIFIHASPLIAPNDLYNKLKGIADGTNSADEAITKTLNAFNIATGYNMDAATFWARIKANFSKFLSVITLYQKDSKCDLATTELRTIQSIYENPNGDNSSIGSGLASSWPKIHRFVRLWRKLGWTMRETDLVLTALLTALQEKDITYNTIRNLEAVVALKTATKLPIEQLAVLWGNIDTYGNKSLYKKLFLNKAAQQIDDVFKADAAGNYLVNVKGPLIAHQQALLAAFRLRENEFIAILEVTNLLYNEDQAFLNLSNLSLIYRYVVLARALKITVIDLCILTALLHIPPFKTPQDTLAFYELADSVKKSGFKAQELQYILDGVLPENAKFSLAKNKVLQTAKTIREMFFVIEQYHPQTAPGPLTEEILTAKLTLMFQPEIVQQLMQLLKDTAYFEIFTVKDLNVIIPETLSQKYTYSKASGMLKCRGSLDPDSAVLKHFADYNLEKFKGAIDTLFSNPDGFLVHNSNPQTYKITTVPNLDIVIPTALSAKYTYDKSKGQLISLGIMSEIERAGLKDCVDNSQEAKRVELVQFQKAVDALYAKPEDFKFITPSLNAMVFEVTTDPNLSIALPEIPEILAEKYSYQKDGILKCVGVMSETERKMLKGLSETNANFITAIDTLHSAPEKFIKTYFQEVFIDEAGFLKANDVLFEHPGAAIKTPALTLWLCLAPCHFCYGTAGFGRMD